MQYSNIVEISRMVNKELTINKYIEMLESGDQIFRITDIVGYIIDQVHKKLGYTMMHSLVVSTMKIIIKLISEDDYEDYDHHHDGIESAVEYIREITLLPAHDEDIKYWLYHNIIAVDYFSEAAHSMPDDIQSAEVVAWRNWICDIARATIEAMADYSAIFLNHFI